ncbi:MAG: hypothetical protein ACOCUT_03720 [bacterium]
MVKQDEVEFKGGVLRAKVWEENMTFHRVTWFKELAMMFDAWLYPVDKDSPFYQWFSESERGLISSCNDFIVTITYALPSSVLNQRMFKNIMQENGYLHYSIPDFSNHLKAHPDYVKWTLHKYKIGGFCLNGPKPEQLQLNFPGFKQATLNLIRK